MKQSKYVTIIPRGNGDLLVHSGLTGAVLAVTEDKVPEFRRLLGNENEATGDALLDFSYGRVREAFHEAMILVDDDLDEIQLLERRYRQAQFEEIGVATVIVTTTMRCNLACPYCYNPTRNAVMDAPLRKEVSLYVENEILPTLEGAERKILQITWIGGEPLTDWNGLQDLAQQLYAAAEKRGVEILGDFITNATLLTEDKLRQITQPPFCVKRLQITLDGHQSMHDATRCYPDGRPTFELICDKVKLAREYAEVGVRINVGPTFVFDAFRRLVDELQARGLNDDRLSVHLARLHRADGLAADQVMSSREFALLELACAKYARQAGFSMKMLPPFANKHLPCSGLKKSVAVIDAQGFVSKCWCSMGLPEEAIGHVTQRLDIHGREYLRWMNHNPFQNEACRNCPVLPECAGGCPWLAWRFGVESGEPCIREKFNYRERLLFNYFGE